MTAEPRASVMNLPNVLTISRLVLVPIGLVLMFTDGGYSSGWRIAAFIVFGIAAVTDTYDGYIARRDGLVTDFGKIADPIADKVLVGGVLIGLSVLGDMPWWITIVILTREIGITLLRLALIRIQVMAASVGGKIKTFVQILAIGLYILPWPESAEWVRTSLMALALVLTIGTGIDYVVRAVILVARRRKLSAS